MAVENLSESDISTANFFENSVIIIVSRGEIRRRAQTMSNIFVSEKIVERKHILNIDVLINEKEEETSFPFRRTVWTNDYVSDGLKIFWGEFVEKIKKTVEDSGIEILEFRNFHTYYSSMIKLSPVVKKENLTEDIRININLLDNRRPSKVKCDDSDNKYKAFRMNGTIYFKLEDILHSLNTICNEMKDGEYHEFANLDVKKE